MMNEEQCNEMKRLIRNILAELNVTTIEDFILQNKESGLYEILKAGVLEE